MTTENQAVEAATQVGGVPAEQEVTEQVVPGLGADEQGTEQVAKTDEEVAAEAQAEIEHEEKQKKSGFERRVQKLNSKIEAAKNEAEYWREQALKNSKAQDVQQAPQEAQEQALAKPAMANYSNIEEYTEALTDYKLALRDQQQAQRNEQAQRQKALDNYNAKVKDFVKTTPDFAEALDDVSDMAIAPEIHQAILGSDAGPQLAYYMAKNVDEIDRINSLSPQRRLIEMGKIEDRLAKTAPVVARVTKPAPAPVKPVAGGAPISQKSVYEMTAQELMRHRNEQEGRIGRRR